VSKLNHLLPCLTTKKTKCSIQFWLKARKGILTSSLAPCNSGSQSKEALQACKLDLAKLLECDLHVLPSLLCSNLLEKQANLSRCSKILTTRFLKSTLKRVRRET
jgi:hypothetical protein